MGDEIELASKTVAETAGAVVEVLAEKSGALEPVHEFADYITWSIHYRYYPRVVRQALAAAEKIERSGLPRRAYAEIPDKLLRAILEGGATEDDESMQERWENLLANAVTAGDGAHPIPPSFPAVLNELEPAEAAALDAFVNEEGQPRGIFGTGGLTFAQIDNLKRLRLLNDIAVSELRDNPRPRHPNQPPAPQDVWTTQRTHLTQLGSDFVMACRPPRPSA